MYPYNTQNNNQHATPIKTQESTNLNTRESSLSARSLQYDERLINLLHIAAQEARTAAETYQTLLDMEHLENDFPILRNAYLDEVKHQNLIQEIYYQIFHDKLDAEKIPKDANRIAANSYFLDSFEEMILSELENIDFYRELLTLIPDNAVKDMLWEIILDKQDHSMRMQHLYCKYKNS